MTAQTDGAQTDGAQTDGPPTDGATTDGTLPPDLAAYRETYREMFGEVPPLPEGKFAFTASVDPQFLRHVEALRAHAFDNTTFKPKLTQLIIVAMMLATGGGAAEWHVRAARRAGATWLELQTVAELAAAVAALGPANVGGALLNRLRAAEERS